MTHYTLPELPYPYNALEPYISEEIMRLHHRKHHQTYLNALNAVRDELRDHPEIQDKGIEDLIRNLAAVPDPWRTALRENGGGHANHSIFWEVMAPSDTPGHQLNPGPLKAAIDADFGGLENLMVKFNASALGRFGSGWAWLVVRDGKLAVCATPYQDNPLMDVVEPDQKGTPILGLDVWEHAYYLQYKNVRPDYIRAFWHVVNFDEVARRFEAAMG